MKKSDLNIIDVINEYNICKNIHKVANKFNTSHIRVSKLLKENNIIINNVGNRKNFNNDDIINMINDYINNHLTMDNISKKYGIRIKRLRQIFKDKNVVISKWNGHIKKSYKSSFVKDVNFVNINYKNCPYCDWKTKDVLNKSHAYQKHLFSKHDINIDVHLSEYPEDIFYLKNIQKQKEKVKCEICGKHLWTIDKRHLDTHNISKVEYIQKYGNNIISKQTKNKLQNCLNKMYENEEWDRYSSSYETYIQDFLAQYNVNYITHNRKILNGLEIDILVNDIGIEFNGLKYHTEWFGKKDRNYHLNKLNQCNEKGIKLLQIFEDEFVNNKELVLNKISHILNINTSKTKIMGRKCLIKLIDKNIAEQFLNIYHIQGFSSSTVYLGAFYGDKLIAVMSFKKEDKECLKWELNRFASDYNYICQGVGGKLFKYFIKNYNPNEIKSFADRRWTLDINDNLYVKLGFKLEKILKPEYRYYNNKVDKYTRFHKFGFRKQVLHKKYNLPLSMTETEMTKELGYDRIWDCGLFKFIWKKNSNNIDVAQIV